MFVVTAGAFGAAVVYAVFAHDTWQQIKRQADDEYLTQHRPVVWARMLDKFQIEVGKPLGANIQISNYSTVPTLVRARIRIEVSPTIIDKLRKEPHPFPHAMHDQQGVLTVLLAPHEQTDRFPIEPRQIVTRDEYQQIQNGTLDVAVYGRIDYDMLRNPLEWATYSSDFCFYRMADGSISTCPNYQHHYTNWIPE